MSDNSNMFSRFLNELKRRKTDRVIVFYAAVAFVVLQLISIIFPALNLPAWATTFVIILLAIGFPVAAILSWVFDLTPEGIEKTKPFNEKRKHHKHSKLRLWKNSTVISIIIIIVLIVFNIFSGRFGSANVKNLEKSIAVLPFQNPTDYQNPEISPDKLHIILSNDLGNIARFRMKHQFFTEKYRDQKISPRRVGKQLGVSFLLYGQLLRVMDSLVLSLQLINAESGDQIWSNNYTMDLNLSEFMNIKNDIPVQIALKLETPLSTGQKETINKRTTKVPAALVKALEGKAITDQGKSFLFKGYEKFEDLSEPANLDKAIKLFDEAIISDPNFAFAYAQRAITRSWAYYRGATDSVNIIKCREDIDKALALEPDSKDAQIAEGFYNYYCILDYPKALYHFKEATDKDPEDWQSLFFMSLVTRRMGNWNESRDLMEEVLKFRPQNALFLTNIGLTYDYMRNYDSALIYHNLAIRVSPDWISGYKNKMETMFRKTGKTKDMKPIMSKGIRKTGDKFLYEQVMLDIYDGKFMAAENKIKEADSTEFGGKGSMYIFYAKIHSYSQEFDAAKSYYTKAAEYFENKLRNEPEDLSLYSSLGIAYAGMKRGTEAIEAGEKAADPAQTDALDYPESVENLALIYTMAGEYDNAFDKINYLLSNNTCFTVNHLQLDPEWKPLRDQSKYQDLIMKYSKK